MVLYCWVFIVAHSTPKSSIIAHRSLYNYYLLNATPHHLTLPQTPPNIENQPTFPRRTSSHPKHHYASAPPPKEISLFSPHPIIRAAPYHLFPPNHLPHTNDAHPDHPCLPPLPPPRHPPHRHNHRPPLRLRHPNPPHHAHIRLPRNALARCRSGALVAITSRWGVRDLCGGYGEGFEGGEGGGWDG